MTSPRQPRTGALPARTVAPAHPARRASRVFRSLGALQRVVRTGQRGMLILDVVLGVAVMGVAGVAAASALSTSALAARKLDFQATAHLLAKTQMEAVKAAPYVPAPTPYPTVTPLPGYTIGVATSTVPDRDANLEKVTVTVTRGTTTVTLEDYKANR